MINMMNLLQNLVIVNHLAAVVIIIIIIITSGLNVSVVARKM